MHLTAQDYDEIPDGIIKGRVLDIGPGTGVNSLLSRHAQLFVQANTEGRYRGIEYDPGVPLLKIERGDITRTLLTQQYDTILILHVLEHIEQQKWRGIFDLLIGSVAPGGHLIVGTPCGERRHRHWGHVTFDITPRLLRRYIPGAKFGVSLVTSPTVFRKPGRILPWWIRLLLWTAFGHFEDAQLVIRGRYNLIGVWRKPANT